MKVFKFGGASVKDANSVRNLASIIANHQSEQLIVIISAMGKMTNSFEWLINAHFFQTEKVKEYLNEIVDFHNHILWDLFPDKSNEVYVAVNELFFQLEEVLDSKSKLTFDESYDSLVGFGELLSTTIVSHYLNSTGVQNEWLDARKVIQTNSDFRQAKVDWETTEELISKIKYGVVTVSQGFIGSDTNQRMTSLGREGSDFSAAIFG
ncbi:MAG: aspartate kinase, partial [Flavobacteriales bacterium]